MSDARYITTTTSIWIKTTFEAMHRWEDAPEEVFYLKDYHRHVFFVKLGKRVRVLDREIEFIQLKHKVDEYCNKTYDQKYLEDSCEMIAENLLHVFDADYVEVSEDNENGARVERQTPSC